MPGFARSTGQVLDYVEERRKRGQSCPVCRQVRTEPVFKGEVYCPTWRDAHAVMDQQACPLCYCLKPELKSRGVRMLYLARWQSYMESRG
jgi:hypothetical protein